MWDLLRLKPVPTAGPRCMPCVNKHGHRKYFGCYYRVKGGFHPAGKLLEAGTWGRTSLGLLLGSPALLGAWRRPLGVCFRHLTSGSCRGPVGFIKKEWGRGTRPHSSTVWFRGCMQHGITQQTWPPTQQAVQSLSVMTDTFSSKTHKQLPDMFSQLPPTKMREF